MKRADSIRPRRALSQVLVELDYPSLPGERLGTYQPCLPILGLSGVQCDINAQPLTSLSPSSPGAMPVTAR